MAIAVITLGDASPATFDLDDYRSKVPDELSCKRVFDAEMTDADRRLRLDGMLSCSGSDATDATATIEFFVSSRPDAVLDRFVRRFDSSSPVYERCPGAPPEGRIVCVTVPDTGSVRPYAAVAWADPRFDNVVVHTATDPESRYSETTALERAVDLLNRYGKLKT